MIMILPELISAQGKIFGNVVKSDGTGVDAKVTIVWFENDQKELGTSCRSFENDGGFMLTKGTLPVTGMNVSVIVEIGDSTKKFFGRPDQNGNLGKFVIDQQKKDLSSVDCYVPMRLSDFAIKPRTIGYLEYDFFIESTNIHNYKIRALDKSKLVPRSFDYRQTYEVTNQTAFVDSLINNLPPLYGVELVPGVQFTVEGLTEICQPCSDKNQRCFLNIMITQIPK